MLGRILRAAKGQGEPEEATKARMLFHWRCECGARSRDGDPFKMDAEYNAQRHQWRKGVGHPMPEVYAIEVEVPADWP